MRSATTQGRRRSSENSITRSPALIATAISALGTEPRPPGARQLVGYPGLWRVRLGDYRVVYAIRDAELVVLALRIAHRDVYRNL